ncbi:Maestro heat-like repeat family member 5 [Microtus ochrogaster]|uniref:Maestro heat-like repeat family member 5 n=1 Tax=Microtus ochrogaster TaxID=79684 RepID=A0A8J6GZH3_MICOH|nr:Maestro heat-like repeat family member 5 [Microtus ochrogaster]
MDGQQPDRSHSRNSTDGTSSAMSYNPRSVQHQRTWESQGPRILQAPGFFTFQSNTPEALKGQQQVDLVSSRPPASQGYTVRNCQEEERKKRRKRMKKWKRIFSHVSVSAKESLCTKESQDYASWDRQSHPATIMLCRSKSSQASLVPKEHQMFMEEAYNSAICFKMLRDIGTSDPLQLKYITKKMKKMAQRCPSLVMESIHDYFKDNPEVLFLGTLEQTWEHRGRLDPKWGLNPESYIGQLYHSDKKWCNSISLFANRLNKEEGTCTHVVPTCSEHSQEISNRHRFRLFHVLQAVIGARDVLEETWQKYFMQLALEHMTKSTELDDIYQDAASNVLLALCRHSWPAVAKHLETELLTGVFPHRSLLYVMGTLSSQEELLKKEDRESWKDLLSQMARKSVPFLNTDVWSKELLWTLTKSDRTQQAQTPEKDFLFTYYGLILQAEEKSITVRTHLKTLLETSHQWPKQREGIALTMGLAAVCHLDDTWAVLEQFGKSTSVKWSLQSFSLKPHGQSLEDLRWKWAGSTILLSYGQMAAKAKSHILPWVDNILSRMIFYFRFSSWDETLKQSFLTAVAMLVGAISRSEGAHSYEFSQTGELLECLMILMEKEPQDTLFTSIRQQAIRIVASLCALRPPMDVDRKSRLLPICFRSVFALPLLDALEKHTCLFLEPPNIQGLYNQTMEAMDHMLQCFMMQNPTTNELYFLLSEITGHLEMAELTDLIWTTIDGLGSTSPSWVQASSNMLFLVVQEHGDNLATVGKMSKAIHHHLCAIQLPRAKNNVLHVISLLARNHIPELVAAFLDFSTPLDSHVFCLWKALGAEEPASHLVLTVLMAWLQKRPLPSDASDSSSCPKEKPYLRSLAAMYTIHELQFAREFKKAVRHAFPQLFLALLAQMHYILELDQPTEPEQEQKAQEVAMPSPQSTSLEALKSLLSTTGHWHDFAHLELQSAWEHFTSINTYPQAVGLLARAMVQNHCKQIKAVLSYLLPGLQSQQERERKTAILILIEFLYSPALLEVISKQAVLTVLAQSLQDTSPEIRVASLQGLGNILFHEEKGTLLRGQLPAFLNGFFQNNEAVVVGIMGTVSDVLHRLGTEGAGAQSLCISINTRYFFDDERDNVRAAAMALFGDLVATIAERELSGLRPQVCLSMVPLLLHLKDQCPAVVTQAKFAFYRCAVLLRWQPRHTLFCTLAWENGLSARHFLWTCLMTHSQEEFSVHLSQAINYLHSPHRHIKTWAALFIGYTTCYQPQAVSQMVNDTDTRLLFSTFKDLKKDPEPGIREFATRQLAFLREVSAESKK